MTSPADFRRRLEALLGTVHTADRAAEALGCTSRAVEYWFAGDRPVPLWAVRHLETVETAREGCAGILTEDCVLPECWHRNPPF